MDRDLKAALGRIELTLSFFLAGLATGQHVIGPFSDRLAAARRCSSAAAFILLTALLCSLAADR